MIVRGTLFGGDALGVSLPAEGVPLEIDQMLFMHIRAGKAAELWEVVDTAWIQQLGAIPG